jgi:transaldolase
VPDIQQGVDSKTRVNHIRALSDLGQTVWYDFISRDLYRGPELKRLIEEDGLAGMTSNPTIFQKAIAKSSQYDDEIRRLGAAGKDAAEIFEALAVSDVRAAADVFRPTFDRTGGNSGFVSIEVQPAPAHDTEGTIAEVRRLWAACDRPNVMVKIPATEAGIPAIARSLEEGININITLLFSLSRYRQVMEAYLSALESRRKQGRPIDRVRSVASFFVSRVDTLVDAKLDATLDALAGTGRRPLRGKAAIANAKIAYEAFEQTFKTDRFDALTGAALQKPLWASTSSKDPAYPKLYYVEALVAPDTIDTMPPETFSEYRDHGEPKVRINDDRAGARAVIGQLRELGIDLEQVGRDLEVDGVKKFTESYGGALKTLADKR